MAPRQLEIVPSAPLTSYDRSQRTRDSIVTVSFFVYILEAKFGHWKLLYVCALFAPSYSQS